MVNLGITPVGSGMPSSVSCSFERSPEGDARRTPWGNDAARQISPARLCALAFVEGSVMRNDPRGQFAQPLIWFLSALVLSPHQTLNTRALRRALADEPRDCWAH